MTDTPKTTAEMFSKLARDLVNLYIELTWPYWVFWSRLIRRVPDRAEFERAIRAHYFGMPSTAEDGKRPHA